MAYPLPFSIATPAAPLRPVRAAKRQRAGAWRVAANRALSLRPLTAGELVARQGALWVTLDALDAGRNEASGDHVLAPGQSLHVPAGRHVVLQAVAAGEMAWFDWQPPAAAAAAPIAPAAAASGSLAGAAWQLLRGLLAHGWHRAPRPRAAAQPCSPCA